MGKCSGLKGGGHHRKAVDLASKKKNEKLHRKTEQAAAGRRAVILRDILTRMDPSCDLYLDAAVVGVCDSNSNSNSSGNGSSSSKCSHPKLPDLCRDHFRHEGCTNKRCKFSHEHSISEALANVVSGYRTSSAGSDRIDNYTDGNNDHDSAPTTTLPALRHLPGIFGGTQQKTPRRLFVWRSRWSQSTRSPLENALSVLEGSSVIDTIVSCLESNRDVVSFGLVCKRLCTMVLLGTGTDATITTTTTTTTTTTASVGCRDVQRRKHRCQERTLERRNTMLLSTKALAGSLRYAVVYCENKNRSSSSISTTSSSSTKRGKGKAKRNHKRNPPTSLRPVLVFDYENPHVYKAFQESRQVVNTSTQKCCLSSSLAKDCTIPKTGE